MSGPDRRDELDALNITNQIRFDALEQSIENCTTPDQLDRLLADRRTAKVRDLSRAHGLDKHKEVEGWIADAMTRVGSLTPNGDPSP